MKLWTGDFQSSTHYNSVCMFLAEKWTSEQPDKEEPYFFFDLIGDVSDIEEELEFLQSKFGCSIEFEFEDSELVAVIK